MYYYLLLSNSIVVCLVLADSDYNATTIEVEFGSLDEALQMTCVPLPIIDDEITNEADEQFSVVLRSVSPEGITISDTEACVTIIDDDGKHSLQSL